MKINTVKIKNFRSYKDEINIEFGDLTAFVGKNDIGKSTVLEALDIFFNDSWILRTIVYHLFQSIVYQCFSPKFTTR